MNKWQRLHEQYAEGAFQGNGHAYTEEARIAEMERLIGQQAIEIDFLKKVLQDRLLKKSLAGAGAPAPGGRAMSQAIQDNLQEAAAQGGSLTGLCQTAGASRSRYYRGLAAREPVGTDAVLREHVQRVALECSCYGYRRVTKELHRQGIRANHKRVLRLMRQDNLLCLHRRRFVATTDSAHGLPVYPNLAADMDVTAPDQLWVSDITYITPIKPSPGPRVRLPGGRAGRLFTPLPGLGAGPAPGCGFSNGGPTDGLASTQA